jgi:hypothetical protein
MLKNLLNSDDSDNIEDIKVVIKFARYTTDNLLILATNAGQYTFDVVDLDFSVSGDQILFTFYRDKGNNRIEDFNVKIDNSPKYQEKNNKIIQEFREIKKKKIADLI